LQFGKIHYNKDVMKRILVTGGAGFVGSNLVYRLIKEGHSVTVIDDYSTGLKSNEVNGASYFTGDITAHGIIEASNFKKYDVIYHLAAMARIQPSLTDPVGCINTNFGGTLNVMEYARENKCQIIYAGSSSKHVGLYVSPYAWSKFGGEELCKLYSTVYDLNTTICRFYNVYGPNQIKTGDYATIVGIFEDQYAAGKPLTPTGDGEQRRDFTHVDDIVDGLYRCLGKSFRAQEFEFGTGYNYSINEVAAMFGDYPVEYIPARSGEYPTTLCTSTSADLLLGWSATDKLKDWIKNFVEPKVDLP
tara:strand:- start:894 stop:1802 length:909 start_codon:yes stop_codon:yes gene_type:complete